MKKLIAILLLATVIVFGYFAYKSFQDSAKDLPNINKEDVKGFIDDNIDKAKEEANKAKDQVIQDVKNQANEALKNKVDKALGTK